jgi:hypothetical protein
MGEGMPTQHHKFIQTFFFFGSTGVLTQGHALAWQVLYYLEPCPQPFFLSLFLEQCRAFIFGLAWVVILPFVLPHLAGMTGMHHHVQLFIG